MITIVLVPGTQNLYVKSWCDKVKRHFLCHIHKSWIKIFVICISTSKLLNIRSYHYYHALFKKLCFPEFGKAVKCLLVTQIRDPGNLTVVLVMKIVRSFCPMHLPKHGEMKIWWKRSFQTSGSNHVLKHLLSFSKMVNQV